MENFSPTKDTVMEIKDKPTQEEYICKSHVWEDKVFVIP